MSQPLPKGATIGIIGGGQLGRMLAMAAARLGFKTIVLEPQPDCPAMQVTTNHIVAAYDDVDALAALADRSDVVTYEFENIDVSAVEKLGQSVSIFPNANALRISQDRLVEKDFLNSSGLPTADYFDVIDAASLLAALEKTSGRGILKTRRFGYDGKGQIRFSGNNDIAADKAIDELRGAPAILEGFVDFKCEISVIATRGIDGEISCFEPAENVHKQGILFTSTVPSSVSSDVTLNATKAASQLIEALDYVGTLGLEFFVMGNGDLIANEFAPRVHNSGHWTEAACSISQFEQHIRAIAGWPLIDPVRHSNCVMQNLLGDDINKMSALAASSDTVLHDYGKTESRAGRKMGHFTRISPLTSA